MPPTHWSDLDEDDSDDGAGSVPSRQGALRAPNAGDPRSNISQRPDPRRALANVQNENPAFANLMRQRQALEQRMERALSGGQQQIDPRDALRFQVPGMAQRRAEHEAWQQHRDGRRRQAPRRQATPEPPLRRFGRALGPAGGIAVPRMPGLALRPTAGEQPGGSPQDPARWMQQRDATRPRTSQSSNDYERLDQRLDRARSLAGQLQDPMADMDRQFEEADRKLAAEGLDAEREDLKRMKDDMNIDAFNRPSASGDDTFGKFRSTTDRAKDAGEKIEQNWLARRDAIGGEDMESYMRPLRDAASRALGMGTEDFDRRSDERRTAALEKRRERLREEQAEENRRERALRNRRERENVD